MAKKNKPVDVKRQAQLSALRSSLSAERSNVAAQPSPLEARFARADALSAGTQPSTPAAQKSDELIDLDGVIARENDLRPLRPAHVSDLAASIATVGLIQPPAVDAKGRLLAGEHRRAALMLLREFSTNVEAVAAHWPNLETDDHERIAAGWKTQGFDRGVPVRRMAFDAAVDRARALAVEATENEKRADFSKNEIREVVEKLKAAGFRTQTGRPKKGEKPLAPQLAIIFGKSERQVFNYLAELRDGPKVKEPKVAKEFAVDPMAERLQAIFGVPVSIKRQKNGQSKVELLFASDEQLEKLLQQARQLANG